MHEQTSTYQPSWASAPLETRDSVENLARCINIPNVPVFLRTSTYPNTPFQSFLFLSTSSESACHHDWSTSHFGDRCHDYPQRSSNQTRNAMAISARRGSPLDPERRDKP